MIAIEKKKYSISGNSLLNDEYRYNANFIHPQRTKLLSMHVTKLYTPQQPRG